MQLSAVSTPEAIWLCDLPERMLVDEAPLLVAVRKLQVVCEGPIRGKLCPEPGAAAVYRRTSHSHAFVPMICTGPE